MRSFIFFLSLSLGQLSFALPQTPSEAATLRYFDKLYHAIPQNPRPNISERLNLFSHFFLNKPYLLYALGEGPNASFDRHPRFRADGFDCETFVTTVIALSLASDPNELITLMNTLRYHHKPYQYLNRNHFTDLDWNVHNQKNGILKDITSTIVAPDHRPIAKKAITTINKSGWVHKTAAQRVYLPGASQVEKENAIETLIHQSQSIPNQLSILPYIPFKELFDPQSRPITKVWQQIPNGAIIEIIRPDWALTNVIGTNLNVSHLGLAFWQEDVLWFRHASTSEKKVIELPLQEYLRNALLSPTIKGINVQVVVDHAAKSSDLKQ